MIEVLSILSSIIYSNGLTQFKGVEIEHTHMNCHTSLHTIANKCEAPSDERPLTFAIVLGML